ncbi:MAG: hypothetical protein Athens071425_81 [Parcubacteria group bacterium Athens0714_25]|nr:MAG: hypothetical protein Athens071425_81 [Parcubacteria group bacterium Athens0714_25]
MEKGPNFKIIGNASEREKEKMTNEVSNSLFRHLESMPEDKRKRLEREEYQKSEKEIAVTGFANRKTNQLMQEVGVMPYDIPLENYHIVPSELYANEFGGGVGISYAMPQAAAFNAKYCRNNIVGFGLSVLHETLHLKGRLVIRAYEEEDGKTGKKLYRSGVSVLSPEFEKDHEHFLGLHEGIVSEIEKKSAKDLFGLPELEKEKKWIESDKAKELKKKISNEEGISEDDIMWVDMEGGNSWDIYYTEQRKVIDYLCSEMCKQFPEKFHNKDGAFKIFLKTHFTGKLIEIAKIIEETFGEGSFRLLGNMDKSKESGILHLEALKKARLRKLKAGSPNLF